MGPPVQVSFGGLLHSKAKGLDAYDRFVKDARQANSQECIDLIQELEEQDKKMVEKVKDHVTELLQKQAGQNAAQNQHGSQQKAAGL